MITADSLSDMIRHLIALALFASATALRAGSPESAVGQGKLDQNLLSQLVVEETNRFRESQGREPLSLCPPLVEAARGHASAMAENGFFDHKNPFDSSHRTLTDRIRSAGLQPMACAENIAMTYSLDFRNIVQWTKHRDESRAPKALEYTYRALAKSVVQQWVNSSGHRANLLGRPYSQMGLGFATVLDRRGFERVYCVQTFSSAPSVN